MIHFFKTLWLFITNRCECGGTFIDYDDRKAFCDECGKRD
jgi:hypothetical protein